MSYLINSFALAAQCFCGFQVYFFAILVDDNAIMLPGALDVNKSLLDILSDMLRVTAFGIAVAPSAGRSENY